MGRSGKPGVFPLYTISRVPFVALTLGLSALLWATGCSNTNSAAVKGKGDPLFGDTPATPKAPGVPASPASFGKPPVFSPKPTGTTPASLVNHTEIPGLQGAKPLAIDPGWQRDLSTPAASGPKVMPVPLEKSATPPGLLTTGGWTSKDGNLAPLGGDPIARLEALGALGIRQEPVPGGIRLSCYVPSSASPGSTRLVETTAPTIPDAVQAIIDQLAR